MKRVGVIGQGYVGLAVATAAANAGHTVVGYDTNTDLVDALRHGISHIEDVENITLERLISSGKYLPTDDSLKLSGSEIVIIAVPTPLNKERLPDLNFLEATVETIAHVIKNEILVINESTSYPGTLRKIISEKIYLKTNIKHRYASAPERIDPGNKIWNVANTPRIISGFDDSTTKETKEFYLTFTKSVITLSTPEVAEMSKLVENSFRQVNIAFVNEMAQIANAFGININEVLSAADTKPYGYMKFTPGAGVGGHCIPVDPSYLSYIARKNGIAANFIELANKINNAAPRKIALRIRDSFSGSLQGKRIQIAGISYKPGISDMREAPSIKLISELRVLGAQVFWFDPLVVTFENETSVPLDPTVDLGLIVTPHSIIDFSIWLTAQTKVFDLSASSEFLGWPKFL